MTTPAISKRSKPKQERAHLTYERLLDVAGALLDEVGIGRISTNMICARAELTPPALYRYFDGKYAVLEALGRRLMARKNIVLEHWVARHVEHGVDALRDGIEELQREAAAVTQSEPGAVWILRALHATPLLVHVRLESHRYVTDQLVAAYARHLPHVDRADLWQRLRLAEEVGFAVDEMLQEEDHIAPERAFKHVAALLRMDLSY